ncbi:MAG: hypothetical protein IT289_06305 [Oligoflexia bacterium]|nr:hypothetical protein [Oligoflexia bacterium]
MAQRSVLVILATAFLFPAVVLGQNLPINPRKEWRVIETQNFRIIFDAKQKKLGEEFALEAERAEALLQPLLHTPMPSKVPIVVADITDSPNGYATGVPRPTIVIYPVLPSGTDPVSEYESWVREVVVHEYTHILNFEPTHGAMSVLRFLFGSLWKPNMYLPRWYSEGLAVEMESELTSLGRGKSHYYAGLVRAEVEEGTWGVETIDRIGPTMIPSWPRGQRPYFYGYFLMHELRHLKPVGEIQNNAYETLNHRYGGRIPWVINGPIEDLFELDYQQTLDEMYKRVRARALTQLKVIKQTPHSPRTLPVKEGYFQYGAQISPDGKNFALITGAENEDSAIRVWSRTDRTKSFDFSTWPSPLVEAKDIHQLSWSRDSKSILYDKSGTWENYSTFNDLYVVSLETSETKRLTFGQRAREATFLPDGKIVFVAADGANTLLKISDGDGSNIKPLYAPLSGERVATPRPFQDGVIISRRDKKGREWIEYVSIKDKTARRLTVAHQSGQQHFTPIADPDDAHTFYFASTQTGVSNIYRQRLGQPSRAVTNVSSYAFSPVVDSGQKNIYYSRLTSTGFKLAQQNGEVAYNLNTVPPLQNYSSVPPEGTKAPAIIEEYVYSGSSYLLPQYWIPFIFSVPGGMLFQAQVSGNDPLEWHRYSLSAGYDTRANQPMFDAIYSNAVLGFGIDASYSSNYVYLAGAGFSEHLTGAQLGTRHFLFSDSNEWVLGPQFQYRQTEYGPYFFKEMGPGLRLSYSNVSSPKDRQISPESGKSLSLSYFYYVPEWSNTSYHLGYGSASTYLSGWILPKHHVVSLQLSGWVAPPQRTILTGSVQAGGEYPGITVPTLYVVRGYPVGEFVGSTVFTGSLEYRFPIAYTYQGPGTWPIFFAKWHGALIADAATVEGGYYDTRFTPSPLLQTKLGTFYAGSGAELRADAQLFYSLPSTFRLGAYWGFDSKAGGGFQLFYALALPL